MNMNTEEKFYSELGNYPRPQYPFASLVSPYMDELALECNSWIDIDCPFESRDAHRVYKEHRLTDVAARAFPLLTLEELRPIARFSAAFAIIDDYLDHSSDIEVHQFRERAMALLTGQDSQEPDPGFYHQVYLTRQDALICKMPPHLYEQFVDSISGLMTGYSDEKRYTAANRPPPLPVFQSIRRQTSGGVVYAKYVCMQKNYREIPHEIFRHPIVVRLHDLVGSVVGYQNDFISLPKELSRKGEVFNLVITLQSEFRLGLKEAYRKALEIHDQDLAEFIVLQNHLPNFGKWQHTMEDYVTDLGILIQGVYDWHIVNSGRYIPGAYVEPEYDNKEFTRETQLFENAGHVSME